MKKKVKIAVAGGGTAGHVYPAISVLEYIAREHQLEILYFTVPGKLEERIIPRYFPDARLEPLNVKGFKRPLYNPGNLWVITRLIPIIAKVKKILGRFQPHFVFTTGGYITGPVAFAAHRMKIPLYIHEQNSKVGVANRLSLPYATKIFLSFPGSIRDIPPKYRHKVVVSGNPVRFKEMSPDERRKLRKSLGFEDEEKLVFVMGGSRGSHFLNDLVEKIQHLVNARFIVITGDPAWTKRLKSKGIVAFTYTERVPDILNIADCALTRAGATTIWELYTYGIPAILIPWEGAAEGHQLENAKFLCEYGEAVIIREKTATPEKVAEALEKQLSKPRRILVDPYSAIKAIIKNITEVC